MPTTIRTRILPSVVDSPTTAVPAPVRKATVETPAHRTFATTEMLGRPDAHVGFLHRLEREVHDATWSTRANPLAGALTVRRVLCPNGGAKVTITHSLHAPLTSAGLPGVCWLVVGWRGQAGGSAGLGPELEESQLAGDQTADKLTLLSYEQGEADFLIWPKP